MVRNYQPKTEQSEFVYKDLLRYLNKVPEDHEIFRGTTQFSLPKMDNDKRKATWEHVIRNLSRNVRASNTRNCYIATFKDDKAGNYAAHKFNRSNVHVHRTAAVLAFPDRVRDIARAHLENEEGSNNDLVVAHRCGTAKCFNPRHMTIVTQKVNEDHKGCRYGSRALCPHWPKCIFVKNGVLIPCLNMRTTPRVCKHKPRCRPYKARQVELIRYLDSIKK